jgi:hypothetical protein
MKERRMLKYKGKDSKVLTVLVGIVKLAADLKQPLGWDADEEDPALNEGAHPSDQVLAILEAFGCFEYTSPDTDDPIEVEFYDGGVPDIAGILCTVRDMPEYAEIMTAGIRPDCFSQIPPAKPGACFCEPLKAVDVGAA